MANDPKGQSIGDAIVALLTGQRSLDDVNTELIRRLREISPEASPFGTFAQALFQAPPVIQDRWFKDETLRIDGYTFERCRFDRCKLMSDMATFTFRECFLSPDCGLYFTGPALKVARLLMHALHIKERITPVAGEEALYATLNPDGTFSLE